MHKRALLAAATMLAVALAGCSENPGNEKPDDDAFEDLPGEPLPEGKGVIRGIVLDVAILPIPAVTVKLQGPNLETTTNENGAFVFSGVEPGTYFLQASKPGYDKIQAQVTVVAGVEKPDAVKIQLPRLPGTEPFVVADDYVAFISCGFKTANYVWDADSCDPTGTLGYAASDDSAPTFDTGTTQNATYYQSEIFWEANQPLSSGLVTIQCLGPNAGCGFDRGDPRLCNVRGPSPLVCRVDREMEFGDIPGGGNNLAEIDDGAGFRGEYTIGLFSNCAVQCVQGAVGVGLALEQEVIMYTHVFYNWQPAADWLFIRDGAPPGP